ncbi:hypothetical protein Dimus_005538 [Dionaea muscipula]
MATAAPTTDVQCTTETTSHHQSPVAGEHHHAVIRGHQPFGFVGYWSSRTADKGMVLGCWGSNRAVAMAGGWLATMVPSRRRRLGSSGVGGHDGHGGDCAGVGLV